MELDRRSSTVLSRARDAEIRTIPMLHGEEARDWLAYDAWANERTSRLLALALARNTELAPKIRRTWAHVAAVEELWHARCIGGDYRSIAVWPETDVPEASRRLLVAQERWAESARAWTDGEFARRVQFTNTRGEACEDALGDVVRQVVNHGTHHRAQIAMLLRDGGIEPENVDYIVYCREKARAKR